MAQYQRMLEQELKAIIIVRLDVKLLPPESLERFMGKSRRVYDRRYDQN